MAPRVQVIPATSDARSRCRVLADALANSRMRGTAKPARPAVRRAVDSRDQLMTRFDRLLLNRMLGERTDELLTLRQLCAAVGASERVLQSVCQEFVGMGPMQYWRSLRLTMVRQVLLMANPKTDRVSEIAMRYGFWSLGRFSVSYRAAFGETPSATLRRKAA